MAKHATGHMNINVGTAVIKDSHENVQKVNIYMHELSTMELLVGSSPSEDLSLPANCKE